MVFSMKRSLVVFVTLGLLASLVGCGGSGNPLNIKGQDADREWLIQSILNDDSFSEGKKAAECYVDTVAEAANLTYAELRETAEDESDDLSDVSPEFFAAAMGSFAVCGIELELNWGGGDDSEAGDSNAYEGELVEKSEAERDAISVLSLGDSYTLSDSYWDNGVIIIVSNIEVHPDWSGEKWSPAFSVRVRAVNPTSDDRSAPELKTHCGDPNKFRDEGSWYAGSTYEMYGELPAGTYTEGNLDLAYPRDNDDAEGGYSECETVWVVLEDGDAKVAWVAPEISTP